MPIIVNFGAIIGATVAAMVIGAVWYSKGVFGKKWMRLAGVHEADAAKGAGRAMLLMLVIAFITAYVLAHFVALIGPVTLHDALKLGFWIWLGFVVTVMSHEVIFSKKPLQLFYINAGYVLVELLAMSVILTLWEIKNSFLL